MSQITSFGNGGGGGGGGVLSVQTDSGIATPVAGVLSIVGGAGITTSGTGQTVTIDNSTAITLEYTNVNSSPYVVLVTDAYLSVNSSGGAIIVQLPDAATIGKGFIIKDRTGSAASNNITVTTVGGTVLIDGSTSFVMNTNYQSIQVIGSGTAYEIY